MSTAQTSVGGDASDDGSDESVDPDLDTDDNLPRDADVDDPPDDGRADEEPAGDTLVVELQDGPATVPDPAAAPGADALDDGRLLGNELDVELEAEAAEMAPLVELPDRPRLAIDESSAPTEPSDPLPHRGDGISMRVRGQGRVPARRVRRVIRRIDPVSVLKLSFFFNLCVFAMFLVAAVLLWSAAIGSGSTDRIESFVIDIGFDDFELVGTELFRGFVVFGGALVVTFTVFAVLLALLFNLISDVVGGIRLTVIEPLLGEVGVAGSQGADGD